MTGAAGLDGSGVRSRQKRRREDGISFRSLERRLERRGRLIRVMTLGTGNRGFTIRAVILGRVCLVIESHFAVFIRLAVFRQRDLLRLYFTLLNGGRERRRDH